MSVMGQKINPLCIRLLTNKKRESVWCNTHNYARLLSLELLIRKYINSLLLNVSADEGKHVIQFLPKYMLVDTMYNFPMYKSNKQISSSLNVLSSFSINKKQNNLILDKKRNYKTDNLSFFLFSSQKPIFNSNVKLLSDNSVLFNSFLGNIFPVSFSSKKHFYSYQLLLQSFDNFNTLSLDQQNSLIVKKKVEVSLSSWSKNLVQVNLFHVGNPFLSSGWVAKYIVRSLIKRESFRRISQKIIQKIKQYAFVTGIRIMCSGRFGGSEMARTEIKSYGQTSLHVFAHRIDYAQQVALTSYGLFGIKVWICYSNQKKKM